MRFALDPMLWVMAGVVPLLVWFLVWSWRRRAALLAAWISPRLQPQLSVGVSPARQKLRLILIVVAVVFLFLTLARPQWGYAWEEVRQRGLDIVVAIDTSRSMLARDLPPDRLSRAKLAALDLIRIARSDRLGLVAFAGTAFLQCPLTLDEDAFRQSVEALTPSIMPQGGTALADAIKTTLRTFKDEDQNYRALILLTDGEDHDGGAVQAAKEAQPHNLRIFTIGVGTPAGEILVETDANGQRQYLKDDAGNAVISRLREDVLAEIASTTGGFYLPLRGANTMDVLYEKGLAPLPKSESNARLIRHYHERFVWPLAAAIALLLLELMLPDRRPSLRPTRPSRQPALASSTAAAALLCLASLTFALPALASVNSAQQHIDDGQYSAALQDYRELLKKKPDDPRLHYNTGIAAYRNGEFDEAAQRFQSATQAQDLSLQQQAYYNLGNAHYRSGENAADPQQRTAHWNQAIQQYESALKLNSQDEQARENLQFVKRRLEELQQQQQQQQQQPNQDQQDSNQDEKKSQSPDSSQNQNQQDQQDKNQQQDSSNQPSKDSQDQGQQDAATPPRDQPSSSDKPDKSEEQKTPQSQGSDAADKNPTQEQGKGSDSQAQNQPQDESGNQPEDDSVASGQPGQMTRKQARQLLDAQRLDEKAMLFAPRESQRSRSRHFKDW